MPGGRVQYTFPGRVRETKGADILFVRPASRTCSTGELSGAATGQEVLLARAVAVETAEEAAVDARRSFLKRASEGTRRPSLASPLVSEVAL